MNKLLEIERDISKMENSQDSNAVMMINKKIQDDILAIDEALKKNVVINENVNSLMNEIINVDMENITIDNVQYYSKIIEFLDNNMKYGGLNEE